MPKQRGHQLEQRPCGSTFLLGLERPEAGVAEQESERQWGHIGKGPVGRDEVFGFYSE